MKFKTLIIFVLFFYGSNVSAQVELKTGFVKDDRDGKTYRTVQLGNTIWLAENMRFKTDAVSIFSIENAERIPIDTYYYPFEETDEVCPEGFSIPMESDFTAYTNYIIKLREIPDSMIGYIDVPSKKVDGRGIFSLDDKLKIFEKPNPIALEATGMVENNKLVWSSPEALTFWSRADRSDDPKYHFHIGNQSYINHSHKHHIDTRKRKKRKFVVRCVKYVSEDQKDLDP